MTELVNGTGQVEELNSNPVVPSHPQSAEEKVLRQSEVNELVGRARHEAVERYKRQQQQAPEQASREASNTSGMSHDDINRIAQDAAQKFIKQQMEEAQRKSLEQEAHRVINEFNTKMHTGKERFQDFDQMTGDIDYSRFPNVIEMLARNVDNVSDVMYELGKDRTKLANLETLAAMSPRDALIQTQRLSKALKENDAAVKSKTAKEPLSQMTPSHSGTDNGVKSVRDYRKMFRG